MVPHWSPNLGIIVPVIGTNPVTTPSVTTFRGFRRVPNSGSANHCPALSAVCVEAMHRSHYGRLRDLHEMLRSEQKVERGEHQNGKGKPSSCLENQVHMHLII